jgi:xanthine permease XanP
MPQPSPSKPDNLVFGLEDPPPWLITLLLAGQHVVLLSSRLLYPIVIVQGFGGGMKLAQNMVVMSMIAGGIGTILQSTRKGPVGAGVLDPSGCGAAYIYPSIQAGELGGASLIFGMTLLAGVFECAFSRLVYRLRALFPPHVVGLVVTMVGISMVRIAVLSFVGMSATDQVHSSVWGSKQLKFYSLMFGLTVGYGAAWYFGLLDRNLFGHMARMGVVELPSLSFMGWSFDFSLAGLFAVAFLSTSLKTTGELITCQKINDQKWNHPDMKAVSRGLLSDGSATLISGILGGCGQSSSSSNIGLSLATGATSRRIGLAIGCLLLALSLVPALPFFLAHMPKPVAGGILVYVAGFMVVTGIQIMTTRLLDARKIYVIGVSLVFGLSVDIVPQVYHHISKWLQPMTSSSLSLATAMAIILNLIFRLGIASRAVLEVREPAEASSKRIFRFMKRRGAVWGARADVIDRAASSLTEMLEALLCSGLAKGGATTEVSFDEFNLDIRISYTGDRMVFPDAAPPPEGMLEDRSCLHQMAGYLTMAWADRVQSVEQDGLCRIDLHFDH